MLKKVLAILLTAVICFSFTACEVDVPTPEEVKEKIIEACANVESYEMAGNVDMKLVLDIPGEELSMGMGIPADINTVIDIAAAYDGAGEEMMMAMDIALDMSDEATMKMAMEMYLVDGWMYVMTDMPMMGPEWTKTEIAFNELFERMESIDFSTMQVEFLGLADIVVIGSEEVDGIECYILEITPDMGKLWEILTQQSQLTGGGIMDMPVDDFDEMMENIDDMIKDVSAKYWIAKDTYYIVIGDMTFRMEITPETMGMPDEEGSVAMDMTLGMKMFNYNKPVSIVLPPEAEDAVEGSMW